MTKKDHGLSDLLAFSGKSVLITGAAAGMGAATAKRFAEAGAELHLLDIDKAGLQAVQKTLMQGENEVDIYPLDLGNKEEINRFWEGLDRDKHDNLINNAGIFPYSDFLHSDEAFVQTVLDVNL